MTKNPFVNAIAAEVYIVLVALIMFYGTRIVEHTESVIVPIAMISLFTLSAAIMGYIFLYEPAQLYFGGKKKEGLMLFLQTTALFAILTIIIFALLFLKVF